MTTTEPPRECYWIVPRDKPGVLIVMMRALAGDAHISFEGDLSRCKFPEQLRLSGEETDVLRRNTTWPKQDFVVIPLEPATIRPILDAVLPGHRCVGDIIHIQIEQHGELQFGSYDNFDRECIVCHSGIPTTLLNKLQASGVIRSWCRPDAGANQRHD